MTSNTRHVDIEPQCACGASWAGKRLEHCTVCHKTFTGTSAGDKHRTGSYFPDTRRCRNDGEMAALGFRQTERGYWTNSAPDPRYAATEEPA